MVAWELALIESANEEFIGKDSKRMGRGAFGYVFKVQYGMGTFVARKLIVKRPGEGRAQIRDRAFREYDFMKLARDDPRDS